MTPKTRVIRRALSIAIASTMLASSAVCAAADPWASSPYRSKDYSSRRDAGLLLSLRGGVDFPFTDWDVAFHLNVPIRADVGVHLNDRFAIAGYFRYEKWLGIGDGINDYTFGLSTQLRARSDMTFDPWGGFGVGIRKTGYGPSVSTTGIEFADLQFGADYAAAQTFFLGPYLEFAFDYDLDLQTVDARGMAGLRLSFEP